MQAALLDESTDARTDEALVAAVNACDPEAFEVLYRRHRDWVVNLAYRCTGDRDLALDVLQDTFLYFLKKFPGFRLTCQLRSFLYPAVRHLSIAAQRKARRCQSDGTDLEVSDVFPRRVPDLFVGRPVILAGRFQGDGRKTLHMSGRVGRDRVELPLAVNLGGPDETREAFPSVWARLKIADLADQAIYSRHPFLRGQIRQLALDYSLMSAYTAFVAVDSSTRTAGRTGTTVPVSVPVPEGVKYRSTVEE